MYCGAAPGMEICLTNRCVNGSCPDRLVQHPGSREYVIRSFGLRDAFFVRRLQRQGVRLNADQALLCAQSPLWPALSTPVPWHVNGIATYILCAHLHEQRLEGFVQIRRRGDRAEACLGFVSPDLGMPEAAEIWRRLLQFSVQKASDNGVLRLYASLPDDTEELSILRDASFSLYAREDVYQLMDVTGHPEPVGGEMRPLREADNWQLRRLYAQCTPQPVQLAEGALGAEHRLPFLSDVEWANARSYGLLEGQEISGVVQVMSGRDGRLLRLWCDTMDRTRVARLLDWSMAAAGNELPRPLYCAVRDYQGGVRALLEDRNFKHVVRNALLVRHIQRVERVPITSAVPTLEPRAEAITTMSRMNGYTRNGQSEQTASAHVEEVEVGGLPGMAGGNSGRCTLQASTKTS